MTENTGRPCQAERVTQPITITLEGWTGPWSKDDKDANFKADVAAHAHLDPLSTIGNLSNSIDVPVGSIVHYVLCRWASEGSSGLLELGPRMARRLREPMRAAEQADTDEARLAAYEQVRQMIEWLNVPLDDPDAYPG
ncbi:MAG: hypothetical protein GWP47_08220 [Actinobacteria bacterium]|nr:hypothetical protein [Actinomycetota bacterium]NCG37759.1 hypothetical protein [Actinomycetota bacterium]